MRITRRLLTTVAALAVASTALVLPSAPAQAADNGSWAIVPSAASTNTTSNRAFFNIESAAGQVIKDSVQIKNVTQGTMTLQLYPADAFNSAGGGFALKRQDEENIDLGSWITLETSEIVLEPESQVDVPFTMTVPAGASSGDHIGGIVALNPVATSQQTTSDGAVIQVQQAVGVRIYTRVSGPLNPSLVVSDVKMDVSGGGIPGLRFPNKAVITYTVTNEGNKALSPEADVNVSGLFGRDLFNEEKILPEILPGNSVPFEVTYDDPAFIERMKATVTLTAEEGELTTRGDDVVWMIPWLILLALALGASGYYGWRRLQERGEPESEDLAATRQRGAHAATGVQ